jgi:hypothetical protein
VAFVGATVYAEHARRWRFAEVGAEVASDWACWARSGLSRPRVHSCAWCSWSGKSRIWPVGTSRACVRAPRFSDRRGSCKLERRLQTVALVGGRRLLGCEDGGESGG